jgi:uncharacterized membrane protein YfcA
VWLDFLATFQEPQTWVFAAIGFLAQMCDGMLGMGFGLVSSSVLAGLGLPREVVSASVNGAKLFTGTASASAHIFFKNINWRALAILALAGVTGGLVGAWLLTRGADRFVGPFVSLYLIGVGIYIIWRTSVIERLHLAGIRTGGVGFAGGFLEAISGMWGPVVTSNLVANGLRARFAVGTSNCAETIVAVAVFTILVHHIGFGQLSGAMIGLLFGALIASPMAARLTVNIRKERLTMAIGLLVIFSSAYRLARDLGWLG